MNKETLEEAGVAYAKTVNENHTSHMLGFHNGAKWHQEQNKDIYSEADMREAYFTAIRSTGEGWNGEYANGNCPNIEKTFNDGFEIFIEQFKNK
jgi:hypothetical protein